MFAAVLLLSCGAEPPQFQVENKTVPTFTVTKQNPPRCTCAPGACDCIPDFGGMGRCGCFPPIARAAAGGWQRAPEYTTATHDLYRLWDGRQWHQEWRGKSALVPIQGGCPGGTCPLQMKGR